MVAVRAVAVLVSLLEHAESCGGDHIGEGAARQVQLADGLLGKNREHAIAGDSPHMARRGGAKSVAEAHGKGVAPVALRFCIGKQRHQRGGVFHAEGAELHPFRLLAGERRCPLAAGRQKLFPRPVLHDGADSSLRRVGRVRIDVQPELLRFFTKRFDCVRHMFLL